MLDRLLGTRQTTVTDLRPETPTIVSLRLQRPLGYHYHAGQFALLRLTTPAGPDLRPLSLASDPHTKDLRFATRRGPSDFKQALLALRPGDEVKVSRALGSLRLDPTRPAILVAGGVGAAPMLSLAAAASIRPAAPVRLILSNRTADEIPFRSELEHLSQIHPQLRITSVVTSETGRITAEQLRWHADELPDAVFYVTGPAALVTDVVATLRAIGVPRHRIRLSKQTLPFPRQRSE
jgi:ferredoxin-NADP reductase